MALEARRAREGSWPLPLNHWEIIAVQGAEGKASDRSIRHKGKRGYVLAYSDGYESMRVMEPRG